MKNKLTLLTLPLSIAPLAFWKMDGPYGQSIHDNGTLKRPIHWLNSCSEMVKKMNRTIISIYNYVYIYNPQTGYSVGYIPEDGDLNLGFLQSFLLGQNTSFSVNSQDFNSFYFCKEKSNVDQTERIESTEGTKLYSFITNTKKELSKRDNFLYRLEPQLIKYKFELDKILSFVNSLRKDQNIPEIPVNPIKLSNKITTQLGIEVINENNKVKIKKGDQVIDFQKALEKYFNYDKNQAIILDAVNQSMPKDRTEKGQNLNSFDIGQAAV